ncbi:MAG: 4Fe-4S binding protein, partial [Planctomycetes bacterium]|nr:4Fe-4S binding protein [Planctomycetota bacterium]
PSHGIEGGKKRIHVIDQGKCDRCGVCFEVCPPRYGAVRKLSGEAVPEPVPESARAVAGKGAEDE